jgi:hypothetical protein
MLADTVAAMTTASPATALDEPNIEISFSSCRETVLRRASTEAALLARKVRFARRAAGWSTSILFDHQ